MTKYFIATSEEVEARVNEPFRYFLYEKEKSNEFKGNLLRELAESLSAQIRFRFEDHFDSFCVFLMGHIFSDYHPNKKLGEKEKKEKEAMYRLLNLRVKDGEELSEQEISSLFDLLSMELAQPDNSIVAPIVVKLLGNFVDFKLLKQDASKI